MDAKHYPLRGVTTVSVTVCGSLCLCDGPSGLHASVRRQVGRSTILCIRYGAYGPLCDVMCDVEPVTATLTLRLTTLSSNVVE